VADHHPDRSGPVLRLARPDPGGAHPLPAGGPAGDDRDDRRASARGPRRSAIEPGSRRFRPAPVSALAGFGPRPTHYPPAPAFSAPAVLCSRPGGFPPPRSPLPPLSTSVPIRWNTVPPFEHCCSRVPIREACSNGAGPVRVYLAAPHLA